MRSVEGRWRCCGTGQSGLSLWWINTEWEHREAGNRQAGPPAGREKAKLETA